MPARAYTDVSDQQVVVFAQEGREDAYRELIKRYERPVFSLIYRMVRDKETAEDLAQETFIKVLNNIDRYRPEFKFSSWLFKIANNITIDHLRRRQVDTISIEGSPTAITAESVRATAVTVTSGGESPLEELESRELGAEIEKSIARLRPEYRGNREAAAWHSEDLHPPCPPGIEAVSGGPPMTSRTLFLRAKRGCKMLKLSRTKPVSDRVRNP